MGRGRTVPAKPVTGIAPAGGGRCRDAVHRDASSGLAGRRQRGEMQARWPAGACRVVGRGKAPRRLCPTLVDAAPARDVVPAMATQERNPGLSSSTAGKDREACYANPTLVEGRGSASLRPPFLFEREKGGCGRFTPIAYEALLASVTYPVLCMCYGPSQTKQYYLSTCPNPHPFAPPPTLIWPSRGRGHPNAGAHDHLPPGRGGAIRTLGPRYRAWSRNRLKDACRAAVMRPAIGRRRRGQGGPVMRLSAFRGRASNPGRGRLSSTYWAAAAARSGNMERVTTEFPFSSDIPYPPLNRFFVFFS